MTVANRRGDEGGWHRSGKLEYCGDAWARQGVRVEGKESRRDA
jgi:hypothetical protein